MSGALIFLLSYRDDGIKWNHFPRYWPFVRGNSPVTGELLAQKPVTRSFGVFPLICAWTNGWGNNRGADNLRRHRTHYDVIVMQAEHTVDKTTELPVILYLLTLTRCHNNGCRNTLIPQLSVRNYQLSNSCLSRLLAFVIVALAFVYRSSSAVLSQKDLIYSARVPQSKYGLDWGV